jgi:hypothetical protein
MTGQIDGVKWEAKWKRVSGMDVPRAQWVLRIDGVGESLYPPFQIPEDGPDVRGRLEQFVREEISRRRV